MVMSRVEENYLLFINSLNMDMAQQQKLLTTNSKPPKKNGKTSLLSI